MAQVIGKCGSFKAAEAIAEELDIRLTEDLLLHLDRHIKAVVGDFETALEQAKQRVDAEIAALAAVLDGHGRRAAAARAMIRASAEARRHNGAGPVGGAWLRTADFRFALRAGWRRWQIRRRWLAKQRTRNERIDREVHDTKRRRDALTDLRQRPEVPGAIGETRSLRALRRLPDEFTVLNDIHFKAPHFMRFRDKPLLTAQADHVVAGPTGVYVIETKLWSREHAETAEFTPQEQVDRAQWLCTLALDDVVPRKEVRSLVAYVGARPPPDPDSFAQVVPAGRIDQSVCRRRATLDPDTLRLVTNELQEMWYYTPQPTRSGFQTGSL